MTQGEFASLLAKKGYTKSVAIRFLHDFTDTLTECLIGGESVCISNLGTFERKLFKRAARGGDPNFPNLNGDLEVYLPRFRPYIALKRAIKTGVFYPSAKPGDHKLITNSVAGKVRERGPNGR